MNLPNQLTVLRLLLTLPFVLALSVNFPGAKLVALVIFIIGSATDYADGYIARRFNLITDFGRLMDPLVDKIMTMSAFICLVSLGTLPAWAVIIIVSREFLITGLRLIAAAQGKVLPAERLGKHKTGWQIATILYCLLLITVGSRMDRGLSAFLHVTAFILVCFTVGLTLWSGISYFAKNWDLVREQQGSE
jgi:CDP-diacylglycerol--glycerol-3-phosphate 3-phosphatidyltransferase